MGVKTAAPPTHKPLLPPDQSMWEKYSPHYEAPLAGATSLFLHGSILGILVIGGMAFFWAAREEADRPPRMDVVMLDGDGAGLEGLGGEAGSPGTPDAGGPKRTEREVKFDNPNPLDRSVPRFLPEEPPQLGLPLMERDFAPLDSGLSVQLAKLQKDAADQANKEPNPPTPPVGSGSDKKPGPLGTGNPKGKGGLGGSGGGPGKGNKAGPGTGTGGFGGPKLTEQQKFAARWNFNMGKDSKEHARILATIGVNVFVEDPNKKIFVITDMNRRPVDLERGTLPDLKKVVGWGNGKPESLQGLARELQLPFTPRLVLMLLPKDREEKMAAEEERFATEQRRDLRMVRKTWFEFRLRNGVYEPVGSKFE